ncbi:MAG: DUF935 family protein [Flavobacterium nitrogenifigens]|uniref:phage portal protein family protein n=1 Tax=Flavobacterium nitrogenifigens TaxID=1617283 RepID=UPI00280850D5|nr:DUF935 family protein [Flavobacterium nitrogenifigens]MDQ8012029.1 DUF935 family protein [Flavobacterium nitrogenifigens]
MKNLLLQTYQTVEKFVLENANYDTLRVAAVSKSQQSISSQLQYESESMQRQTLKEWTSAISAATDPENPDRTGLEALYKNLMLDNHLASIIDSRILFCQRSSFKIVNEKGDENLDISWLFERTWFEEFIKLVLMKRFEGAKLIELFDINPETNELSTVDEIQMSHFIPQKGLITKAPGDSTGWLYKEGAYKPFYIQVGKDKELGMLAQMAPIILAKKLGFGSWLDFIEKYGVPALFITTDREDDQRLKELFEAASNFKGNGFMVGRGNEKFEIGKSEGGNADNFDKLIERANSEMSKRVLGGSGLTDEKSFVGSSEIQFRLAKDRFESDKLLVKNIINEQLIPRLIKISPVYSVLQGHYFEWDNTTTQTPKEVAEILAILATLFELDPEEVSQKTGFKILGQKTNALPTSEQTEEDKKKSLNEK